MQVIRLNKITFLFIFLLGFGQRAYSQIDRNQLALADSLFKANRLLSAEKIYVSQLKTKPTQTENIKMNMYFRIYLILLKKDLDLL